MGLRYFLDDIDEYESIVIYGAGNFGKYIFNKLNEKQVFGFIDEKVTGKILGKKTYTLNSIAKESDYTFVVAVVNPEEKRAITRRLSNFGINDSKIVIPLPEDKKYFFDRDIFFYEDFWMAYINHRLKDKHRLNELIYSNNISSIALVGDVKTNKIVSEKINNMIRIKCYEETDLIGSITEDMVMVCYPCNFLYYYDVIARLTSSPIIDIMRII